MDSGPSQRFRWRAARRLTGVTYAAAYARTCFHRDAVCVFMFKIVYPIYQDAENSSGPIAGISPRPDFRELGYAF